MIIGNEIDSLIDLFLARNVTLFHACQLLDFKSYLRIGGIPSHDYLEKFGQHYTPLDSDQNDKKNGVWDKVFTNLSDFGETFAKGGRSVPNAYGPILMCIKPAALAEAKDVAICLKSAGGTDFSREREALKTVADIDKLFKYSLDSYFYPKSALKYSDELSQTFNYPNPGSPEISCHFDKGRISLEYVEKIVIDPYVINDQSLFEHVKDIMEVFDEGENILICERQHDHYHWPKRKTFYSKLAQHALNVHPHSLTLNDLIYNSDFDSAIYQWAQEISMLNSYYQFARYIKYLWYGTLNEFSSLSV